MYYSKLTSTRLIFCLFFIVLVTFSTASFAGKKKCKPYLEKLHQVQSLQRAGYSAKQGNRLKAREDKARTKWWQCERGLLKTSKAKTKKTKTAKTKEKIKRLKNKEIKNRQLKNERLNKALLAKTNGSAYSVKSVVVKQKYQGEKQRRWLRFYQKPKKCGRPKNMSTFTYCIEDKNTQQLAFEQNDLKIKTIRF